MQQLTRFPSLYFPPGSTLPPQPFPSLILFVLSGFPPTRLSSQSAPRVAEDWLRAFADLAQNLPVSIAVR